MIRFAHSENYPIQLPDTHRFPMQKYELVRQQLLYEGSILEEQCFAPEFIDEKTITATHNSEYWERIKLGKLSEKEIRRIGFPPSPLLRDRSWSSVSGTFRSAENALNDGCGINLAGGTHHAFFDHGEGFCLLNDVAITCNYLLAHKQVKKILIVDLDVHQGNGTASFFQDNDNVFTFSMHCRDNYPYRKVSSDFDLELENGVDGVTYMALLKEVIPALFESEKPDIVFYLAGVDVLSTDRLGKLDLSLNACYERDKWVISNTKLLNIPLVIVMAGGYSDPLSTLVKAHCNTFKFALETYENQRYYTI